MNLNAESDALLSAGLTADSGARMGLSLRNTYRVECWRNGTLAWLEEVPNIVVTVGKNDLLTKYFKGSSYTATWYVGLVNNASFSAYDPTDTMSSHAGWLEAANYSNATRPAWTGGTASAGSIDNSASKAVFNINGTLTIRGAFLTSDNTVSGTSGTLYGESDFTSSRAVLSGDTLNVTVTLTIS